MTRRREAAKTLGMGEIATYRVAVVGAGPVGLATGLLLAMLGVRTAVIAPPQARRDTRTAGLFTGSVTLLQNLGVWDELVDRCAPLSGIRLIDDRRQLLRAPETQFRAEEQGLAVFGFNVPNAAMTEALAASAAHQPNLAVIPQAARSIEIDAGGAHITLTDASVVRSDIVVGADGRNSLVRSAAGIATKSWDYPQAAIVTSFTHQRPHRGVSTEFHRPNGPLTTVPMPGHQSSLVWVDERGEAERIAGLADQEFGEELEARLGGLLGGLSNFSPRGVFPLTGLSAETMGRGIVGLVGEAAHVMPPIGAQGLNLGLRDAAVLAERIADAAPGMTGAEDAIKLYARDRQVDVASRMAAIDALNRSLLTGFLPVHLVRGLGLYALNASQTLRRLVVREGLQPSLALPRSMQPGGIVLRERSTEALAAPPHHP